MLMEISIASFTYNLHTPDQEGREGGVSVEEWGLCTTRGSLCRQQHLQLHLVPLGGLSGHPAGCHGLGHAVPLGSEWGLQGERDVGHLLGFVTGQKAEQVVQGIGHVTAGALVDEAVEDGVSHTVEAGEGQ